MNVTVIFWYKARNASSMGLNAVLGQEHKTVTKTNGESCKGRIMFNSSQLTGDF